MKAGHDKTVTQFVKDNKPLGSPVPKKWFDGGRSLTVDTLSDGTQVWSYTKNGVTVPICTKGD